MQTEFGFVTVAQAITVIGVLWGLSQLLNGLTTDAQYRKNVLGSAKWFASFSFLLSWGYLAFAAKVYYIRDPEDGQVKRVNFFEGRALEQKQIALVAPRE